MLLQKIGKFEILATLGQGAMGTVYRARDPILDRQVALKTVAPELLSRFDTMARFQREARAAARLQHPNIVTIYELGEMTGTLYIAMELLEGMDLAQAMASPERLTTTQKLRVAVDMCRGLDYAHKHGVFHRDVKPANVRILKDGTVKIVDFGIARLEDSTMTQTGLVLGTPSYIAPEVLRGGRVDHRADMWAVGIVLYELLAGKRPFDAPTIAALIYKIVHEPPPLLNTALVGVPPGVAAIEERALAKDPAGRFRDMAEMADALQMVLGLTPSGERPLTATAREEEYQRHLAGAQRLAGQGEVEEALNEARRAQALEPSRSEIVALVKELEDRFYEAATAPRRAPTLDLPPSALMPAPPTPPVARPAAPATMPRPSPAAAAALTPPEARPATRAIEGLRSLGAAAFRELAVFGEPPATAGACLSPARDLLAVAGTDGGIRLWDLHTRMRAHTLRTELHQRSGHDAVALCLAFSTDGGLMASGHVDGGVHLWDVAKGEEVPVRLKHEALVGALAFSPDGSVLASGGMDSNLKLWDLRAAAAGEARRELHRQPSGVTSLTYVGDKGAFLVTGHAKAMLRVLDARSCRLLATLRGPEAQVSLLALLPDGRRVAAASHDRTLRVFDVERRAEVFCVAPHRAKLTTSVAFFPDGRHLASVALDNAVQLWDLDSRSMIAALWGQAGESFAAVALYSGGDHVAVALADGRIRLWGPAA